MEVLTENKRLDGHRVANEILVKLKDRLQHSLNGNFVPTVAFVRVGNEGASVSYVTQKQRTAEKLGIKSILHVLDDVSATQTDLLKLIEGLNGDPNVHGILVQAPLPKHMDFFQVCNAIDPRKDVDGFNAFNIGRLCQEKEYFVPCTPAGIIELLSHYNCTTTGKNVVIVNRSLIVGKPLAMLLLKRAEPGNATVTICHSQSPNLQAITRKADILITACGRPHMFDESFIKEGSILIDVGISRVPSKQHSQGYVLRGDINYDSAYPLAQYITPVPGGVGPLTVCMLMHNTLKAFFLQTKS